MPITLLEIPFGQTPGDGQGIPLYVAVDRINANMQALKAAIEAGIGATPDILDRVLTTVCLELLPPEANCNGTKSFELPRLPMDFVAKDAWLSLVRRTTDDASAATIHCALSQDGNPAGVTFPMSVPLTGIIPVQITATQLTLNAGANLVLDTVISNPTTPNTVQGITLWIRGVWVELL